ncbi:MAG: glycine cleavage system protein GcvH [Planctomycetes bacterium]|nr:glycine cleavage system protein GcvH [Planctomycetota bacterium]
MKKSTVIDANNMRYTRRHEWILLEDDVVTVGITDYVQQELPEVSYVEMPAEGIELNVGDEVVTLESQGDSLTVIAQFDGVVVEVNQLLEDAPELLNSDPYGDGWLFRQEISDMSSWHDLMTAEEYEEYVGT